MRASSERTIGQIIAPTKSCNGATRAENLRFVELDADRRQGRHLVEDL